MNSLSDSNETFIVHVCDCISKEATGITKKIFDTFPYSNTYKNRTDITKMSEPGSIDICGGKKKRYIINFYSKYFSREPKSFDTTENRVKWLLECLNLLLEYIIEKKIENPSMCMPFAIYNNDPYNYNTIVTDFCNKNKIKLIFRKN